jgi:hypothetical protein
MIKLSIVIDDFEFDERGIKETHKNPDFLV